MLNPIASSEAIYSATYVDNYIDSVENLPDDVQRHLSRIRDIDVQYRGHLRDVDYYYDLWKSLSSTSENSVNRRARAIARMQSSLIHAQELGDEKMQIVNQLQELIDQKTRQLDSDQKNLDIKEEQNSSQQHVIRGGDDSIYGGTPQKISRSQSPNGGILLTSVIGIGTSSTSTGQMITGTGKESLCNAFSSALSGGMNQILNERSMVGSNTISAGGSSNGNNNYGNSNSNNMPSSNNSNTASGDGRSTSKRSRRQRNEIVSAMELGGNESNSANEGGSGERGCIVGLSGSGTLSQKQSGSNPSVSTAQKKTQQSGGVGGNVNTTNTGGASGTGGSAHTTKKKKRKARGGQATNTHSNTREDTPPVDPIDPDEPTYCLCDQISFGEMILCDNDLCPIEWFHFSCVSLVLKPKGKWYCPNCRGDRPNVMKPKAQFLKELERYNKEKEEKT